MGESAAPLNHLVVVIPGFGGSILADSDGTPRWGPGFGDIARGMLWAGPLSVPDNPDLIVTGMLQTVTVFPPFVLPGYDRLIRQIAGAFARVRVDEVLPGHTRDPRADLIVFPYDFRHGVRPAAERLRDEMEARLAGLTQKGRRRRVIVVAHSMGGLVARYWLGPLGGAPDCRALITVATPHRGVPKALDWLVNGVHIGRVQLRRMTQVSRQWPGVYDLLPRYPAILTENPVAAGQKGSGRDDRDGRPDRDAQDGRGLRAIGPLELDGVAEDGFAARAAAAFQMHAEIEQAWGELAADDARPEMTPVFARGHATPSRMVLSDRKLRITKADPEWLPGEGWRGDGTVPAIAAIPVELDHDDGSWRTVPERHLSMAGTPAVIDLLRAYDGAPASDPPPQPPAAPWLGLELENVVAAGEPVPVAAEVLGAEPSDATEVWLRVCPRAGPGPEERYRCSRAGRRWQTVITGRAPGAYSLEFHAAHVPGAGWLRSRDVLGAVPL